MNIILNGNQLEITNNSLINLLKSNSIAIKQGIAVAVNNRIVRFSDIPEFSLKENDNILIISATSGG
ncbi:MAG: sulfur carrier protein ThiS [Marinifilaceae bacterium]|jgi:thiamine biosynthesis protein ThiS|nr:sulfur carrier protein ThiS [Marinifilaceae bacterium]